MRHNLQINWNKTILMLFKDAFVYTKYCTIIKRRYAFLQRWSLKNILIEINFFKECMNVLHMISVIQNHSVRKWSTHTPVMCPLFKDSIRFIETATSCLTGVYIHITLTNGTATTIFSTSKTKINKQQYDSFLSGFVLQNKQKTRSRQIQNQIQSVRWTVTNWRHTPINRCEIEFTQCQILPNNGQNMSSTILLRHALMVFLRHNVKALCDFY